MRSRATTDTTVPNIPPIVQLDYGYDKAGNRTHRYDIRPGASRAHRDEQYTYDGLDRLSEAKRGAWNGSTLTLSAGSERWDLDIIGNWNTVSTDDNGDGDYLDTGEQDDRTHNAANELTQRALNTSPTTTMNLTLDKKGLLETADQPSGGKFDYTHDAWGRVVKVYIPGGVAQLRGKYEYNGLNWRTLRINDTPPFDGGYDQERILYYDAEWRLVEERIDDGYDEFPGDGTDRHAQHVWGERRLDEAILRRENNDFTNDSPDITYEDEWFYLTDALYSVVAVINGSNAALVERVRYTPYGEARHSWHDDVDGDGDSDSSDQSIISTSQNKTIDQSGYDADADINRSGKITLADSALYSAKTALASGFVSNLGSGNPDSPVSWVGYLYNYEGDVYTVRNRWTASSLGRWIERDPLRYIDGQGVYQYARSSPVTVSDPSGLVGPQEGALAGR